jgi:hypothetical protein
MRKTRTVVFVIAMTVAESGLARTSKDWAAILTHYAHF